MGVYDELDVEEIQKNKKAVEYLQKLKDVNINELSEQEIQIILENIFIII